MPNLPSVAESGFPGFDATSWYGLMAPAATALQTIERLHQETVKALALPGLRKKFDELAMEPRGNSPREFSHAIEAEIPHWSKVVEGSRIKLPD